MRTLSLTLAFVSLAGPSFAAPDARRITLATMFGGSPLPLKLILLGLICATLATLIIGALKVLRSPPTGGSAFISGMRIGGPVAGLLGAVYASLNAMIGMSYSGNHEFAFVILLLSPAMFSLLLGLFAGVVAIMAHTLVNARIDRALLKA